MYAHDYVYHCCGLWIQILQHMLSLYLLLFIVHVIRIEELSIFPFDAKKNVIPRHNHWIGARDLVLSYYFSILHISSELN